MEENRKRIFHFHRKSFLLIWIRKIIANRITELNNYANEK